MNYEVLIGDCIDSMREMPEKSVHACVTSPPYFGLRDYDMEGQIGLEDTPDAFVARLVDVFREVRRVLRDDGTLWLNLGDSYAANRSYQVASTKGGVKHGPGQAAGGKASVVPDGLKQKDLIGIPWRVAFALQADGWYLRQDIIWAKPNPMPESTKDRCTKSHEYIFLLSKSPKYFFNTEAMREPGVCPAGTKGAKGSAARQAEPGVNARPPEYKVYDGFRNKRSVWNVQTRPYKGAHFATFPPELIEPCILAGAPIGGTVLDPFGGSGTTAGVALKHGMRAVLCELNPAYAGLIEDRVYSIAGLSRPHAEIDSTVWALLA